MLPFESIVWSAFAIGIISAVSLPLGAATSFVWRPDQRVIAWMMAFGAGALLAALSIDLVAPALHHGHFNVLAIGAIIGGLLFIALDQLVGNFGGFRRKFSTVLHHQNLKNREYLGQTFRHLGRADLFRELDDDEIQLLSEEVTTRFYAKGSTIYSAGDRADALYVIVEGEVELLDPLQNLKAVVLVGKGDAFGKTALLTGSPHDLVAKATANTWVTVLTKESLHGLLEDSESYRASVVRWLQDETAANHLRERHEMEEEQIRAWLDMAIHSVEHDFHLPDALKVSRHADAFQDFASEIRRIPWLDDLAPEEAEALSTLLIHKQYAVGEYLFRQNDPANYLYIIESGEVTLSDPQDQNRLHQQGVGDGIGGRAFLCGLRHTVGAQATKDSGVWVLRRHDLENLLRDYPNFRLRLMEYLKAPMLSSYQQQRYHLNQGKVLAWKDQALKAVKAGQLPPSMLEMGIESANAHGASLAIWLGILLDGIPESLVIGANMLHGSISMSLVAGLFLSNYPEALSSSFGMREEKMSRQRILLMWSSIMLFTGIGAALGNVFMQAAEPHWFALLEGLAAGAMLTMIAQTMLPEAYHKGGGITGFATLMGFLATIGLK